MGYSSKPICIPVDRKKVRKRLEDFMKRIPKKDWANRTIMPAAKWLASQYNIDKATAMAYIASVMEKGYWNGNGKVSGHNNRNYRQTFQSILDDYGHLLPEEWKTYLKEGNFPKQVEKIRSPENRQTLLFAEMLAYLQYKHKLPEATLGEYLGRLEWAYGGEVILKTWSKPAFWLAMNLLVFDVLDIGAEEKGSVSADDDTIRINYPRWYETRSYMTETEKVAWQVYDEVVEEIARELVAAAASAGMQQMAVRGLRLLASVILKLVASHPTIRTAVTVAEMASLVASYIENSFLVWLVGQVAIEWKLESWMAFHEWQFLRETRDLIAGYAGFPWQYGFSEDSFQEFRELLYKKFNGNWLTQGELLKLEEYLATASEKGWNWAKAVSYFLELREWLQGFKVRTKAEAEDILSDEMNPDVRDRLKKKVKEKQDEGKEIIWEEINNQYSELIEKEHIDIDNTQCPERKENTAFFYPLENENVPDSELTDEMKYSEDITFHSSHGEVNLYTRQKEGGYGKEIIGYHTLFVSGDDNEHGKGHTKLYNYYIDNVKWEAQLHKGSSTADRLYILTQLSLFDTLGVNIKPEYTDIRNLSSMIDLLNANIPMLNMPCYANIEKAYEVIKKTSSYYVLYSSSYEAGKPVDEAESDSIPLPVTIRDYLLPKDKVCEYRCLFEGSNVQYKKATGSKYFFAGGCHTYSNYFYEKNTILIEYILPFIPNMIILPMFSPYSEANYLYANLSKRCASYKSKKYKRAKGKKLDPLGLLQGGEYQLYRVKYSYGYNGKWYESYLWREDLEAKNQQGFLSGCEYYLSGKSEFGIHDYIKDYLSYSVDGAGSIIVHQEKVFVNNSTNHKASQSNCIMRSSQYAVVYIFVTKITFETQNVKPITLYLDPANPKECLEAKRRRAKVICNI